MNFQSNKLRDAVLVALVAGVASTATAQAQEATNLDRISVTGSRIKSTDIETSQPVLSLTRADIEKQGVTSVADILQRVAANGAALNRTFNNGGDGSAGISLRNLGSERTRYWSTAVAGPPAGWQRRPEHHPDRDDRAHRRPQGRRIDHLWFGRHRRRGEHHHQAELRRRGSELLQGTVQPGDGEREAADFTIGTTTDRASLVLGASYVNEKEVMAGDRKISAGGPPFFGGQSSTGLPGSYIRNDQRYVIINGVETPSTPMSTATTLLRTTTC